MFAGALVLPLMYYANKIVDVAELGPMFSDADGGVRVMLMWCDGDTDVLRCWFSTSTSGTKLR